MQRDKNKTGIVVKINYALLGAMIILFLSSCKTKSYIGKTSENAASPEQILRKINYNYQRFDRIWIKKIRGVYLYENEETNFNCNVRIIKDSIIIISIGIDFGIEAIRIYIEKEKITIINRFNKTWYSDSVSEIKDRYGLINNYKRLEELLLMGVDEEVLGELNLETKEELKNVSLCDTIITRKENSENDVFTEEICLDLITGYLKGRTINSYRNDYEFKIEYSEYFEMSSIVLPAEINSKLSFRDREYQLILYYEKWVANEEFSTKMRISESYRRVNRLIDL